MALALPIIGRTVERDAMSAAYASTQTGQSRLLLITGQAGIGKTRLYCLTPGFTAACGAADQARHMLGDDGFSGAQEEGQALTLDDAVAHAARPGGGRKRPATGWASLTPSELEVVRLVTAGLRNEAIAQRLFIAPGTVKAHLTHIFTKLGITTRTELAAQAATRELRINQNTPLHSDDLRSERQAHTTG